MKTQTLFKISETEVRNLCVNTLIMHGHYVWKNNTGVFLQLSTNKWGQTKKRMFFAGMKGSSDILGIHKSNGRFIAVELKVYPNDTTPHQEIFLNEISKRGGYAIKLRVKDSIDMQKQIDRLIDYLK